jgi:RNA polymerase sigma factor (sigma-70 family)
MHGPRHRPSPVTSGHAARQSEVNQISPSTDPVVVEFGRRTDERVAAFMAEAYDTHEATIFGMLLAVSRDPEVAADLTQDAFLRLLKEARAGRFPDRPGAWLYRTGANLAISGGRRAAVARRLAPRLLLRDEPAQPERLALERERSRSMRDVLAELPLIDRTALVMAAQGQTGEQIAAHLGKSHGATRTLMCRARARLRDAMSAREAGR